MYSKYRCVKTLGTFIYKINNLEYPFYKLILENSEWIYVMGDRGEGDTYKRLRSKDGLRVVDLTESEYYDHFERVN